MANTIADDVAQIRTAVYGRDVRESIAHGIEQCYSDVSSSRTLATTAADRADASASNADTKAAAAEVAVNAIDNKINDIVVVQDQQPTSTTNKLWVRPESDEYQVPTWAEFQALSAKVDELMAWKEQQS